jgi:hypothetical protein
MVLLRLARLPPPAHPSPHAHAPTPATRPALQPVAIPPGGTQPFHVDPSYSAHLAARVPQLSLQGRPLLLSHGPAAVQSGAVRPEDLPEWFRLTFTVPPEPKRQQPASQQASSAGVLEGARGRSAA